MAEEIEGRDLEKVSHVLNTESLHAPLQNHAFNMVNMKEFDHTDQSEGIMMIQPIELYNILMQVDKYPCISDPTYLLLLDARRRETYDTSHIELARTVPKNKNGDYVLPWRSELETKTHIVVYDSLTDRLHFTGKKLKTEATKLARALWGAGARYPVKILRGGYMHFSQLYPFLRTTKMIYLPKDLDDFYTYPLCVLQHKLYMGNWEQGNDGKIQKDLKIDGFLNCCREQKGTPNMGMFKLDADNELYKAEITTADVLHLPVPEDKHSRISITDLFTAVKYIENHSCVLVFSHHGHNQPAAICIAYLMYASRSSLKTAYKYCKKCSIIALPNLSLLRDLVEFEEQVLGAIHTQLEI